MPTNPSPRLCPASPSVLDAMNTFLSNGDLLGIGNLFLEVLFRPNQQLAPDADAQMLPQCVRQIIAHHYQVPETLSYSRPLSDMQLAATDRGSWVNDTYFQLIIMAYAFGASRETLPPPHDKLVSYYKICAKRQRDAIKEAVDTYKSRRSVNEIRQTSEAMNKIHAILDGKQTDPALMVRAIAALVRTDGQTPPVRQTLTTSEI